MTIQEQLKFGDHIFAHIKDLVNEGKLSDAYDVIRNTVPPPEWVSEFESLLSPGEKYKTMKIELMEAVMREIFGNWEIDDISQPIITATRDKVSVTLVAKIGYPALGGTVRSILTGIATEVAHNIAVLPLATPKCLAMAKKQAFKQLGNLFGLALGREIEGEEVNLAKVPENLLVKEAIAEIYKTKTIEELTQIHNLCAKEVQNDPDFTMAVLSHKKILTLTDIKDARE